MKVQLEFDFERKFDSLKEAIVHSAFNSGIPIKHLAARLDHSPSNLSRRLSLAKDDKEPSLSVEDLEGIIEATADYTPIYYLIDKFVKRDQDKLLVEFQEFRKKIPDLKRFIALVESKK